MDAPPARILVVDDEEDTASLVADCLRRRGYNSAFVTSARQCLEYLGHQHIDVVITDVQMPEMSGLQLCERLREEHPECVPIVLTGHGKRDMATAASDAGAFAFMAKPAKVDALDTTIQRALVHLRSTHT